MCPLCRSQFPAGAGFCPHDGHQLHDLTQRAVEARDPFIDALIDDRYRVEARLGQGGMGVVYAARHVVIDKPVAIKILRDEYCRDHGMVERFMREAQAASRIGHPHIVDVTDFGRLGDGHIYFVMEFLAGTTLSRVLRRHGQLPTWLVLQLSIQIAHGLQGAHAKGIVHRDLKPENIFIVNPSDHPPANDDLDQHRTNFVKLLDFGIAKISWGKGTRLTKAGSIFGTPQYMSPEQAAGEDGDHRGDIYALGCIVYEMLTGEVPFTAETFMGTLTKHMFEAPRPPRQLRPELAFPSELEQVVLRALAKDPAARFQTMDEMAAALSRCAPPAQVPPEQQAQDPGSAQLATATSRDQAVEPEAGPRIRFVPPTEDVRPLRRQESRSLGWAVGVFGIVILAGVTALVLSRDRRTMPGEIDAALSTISRSDGAPRPADGALAASERADGGLLVVWVISIPQGAALRVDDALVGNTPHRLLLAPGQRVDVVLDKRGYRRVRRRIVGVAPGKPVTIRLRPQDDPAPRLRDLRNPYEPIK